MYAVYHIAALFALLFLLWVLLPDLSKVGKNGSRTLGRMEKTLHAIYNSCGHLNNAICAQVEGPIDGSDLIRALSELQRRHAILQSNIVQERRSMPNEWETILQKEVNTNFQPHTPLIRCVLLYPVGGKGNSDLILTIRSDMADVRSCILLLSELMDIYYTICIDGDVEMKERAIIPPSTDSLLPPGSFPPFLFVQYCATIIKRHDFTLPDSIPFTGNQITRRGHGWTTKWLNRTIDSDITSSLVTRCLEKGITVESLVFVAMMLAVARLIRAEEILQQGGKDSHQLWGVLVKDMRAKRSNSLSIGVFFSLLDFVCNFHNNDLDRMDLLWDMAQDIDEDFKNSVASGSHVRSMIFTEYISQVTSLYSKYFTKPFICPSFGLQFLNDIENSDAFHSHVLSFSSAHSSTTSYPLPVVTSYIFKRKLLSNLCYSKETSSTASMASLMDEYVSILSSL